jgi:imidazolonepropionase-like amidohydrolase
VQAFVGDVAVTDGKIVAIGPAGTLGVAATRTIDATGMHVIPMTHR